MGSDRIGQSVIVLVGMMGCGKTTIGRELGPLLGLPVVDSDDLIADKTSLPAASLLRADADRFRVLEAESVAEVIAVGAPCVLSIGGGAVSNTDTSDRLRSHHPVVWLRVPHEELLRRIVAHGTDRPMLDGDVSARLLQLMKDREPTYRYVADLVIDGDAEPGVVAKRIVEAFT